MKSETFGERIKRLRLENHLSLRIVAAAIDFDQSSLSKIERNENVAPQRIIMPLAKVLKQDYKDLQIKYLSEKIYYELRDMDYALEALAVTEKRLQKEKSGTSIQVKRALLIQKIQNYFNDQPVDKAWLFGSFARNEESLDSDIDILVKFKKPNTLDLFDYVGLTQDLEDLTGRQVDLVAEGYLKSNVEKNVAREKVLIYER